MNTFLIKSTHDVCNDNYEQGEGERVNWYNTEAVINAETQMQAIQKYFETHLFCKFNKDFSQSEIDENILHYSVLVDEENTEANEAEINQWKQDEKKLYSNNIALTVYLITKQKINLD